MAKKENKMNAKEFAHELEKAASFIRQQQAEIEALKAGKIRAYDNGVEDGRKPNTHPAKELTDEEIYEVWKQTTKLMYRGVHEEFAKAILRKAQEK